MVLQRLIETEEAGVRKLRNAQKLIMGMKEAAQILRIPISLSNYHDLMLKVFTWYVPYAFFLLSK